MEELRMTGNCLKGSRPLLSFDPMFDNDLHYSLLKELFVQVMSTSDLPMPKVLFSCVFQIFGVPNNHPKSQPFYDHVFTFNIVDHRIWFRNYQIVEEDGSLAEIGPRFVLNLIKIFDSSFNGRILYSNPHYVSPNKYRRSLRSKVADKYKDRLSAKQSKELRQPKGSSYADVDQYDHVFDTVEPERANRAERSVFQRSKE